MSIENLANVYVSELFDRGGPSEEKVLIRDVWYFPVEQINQAFLAGYRAYQAEQQSDARESLKETTRLVPRMPKADDVGYDREEVLLKRDQIIAQGQRIKKMEEELAKYRRERPILDEEITKLKDSVQEWRREFSRVFDANSEFKRKIGTLADKLVRYEMSQIPLPGSSQDNAEDIETARYRLITEKLDKIQKTIESVLPF